MQSSVLVVQFECQNYQAPDDITLSDRQSASPLASRDRIRVDIRLHGCPEPYNFGVSKRDNLTGNYTSNTASPIGPPEEIR